MTYVKFAKNIFTIGFLDFLGIVQGLVFLSLITKVLGASDYGIWSQIRVTMSLAVSFTFLGLHEALIRFLPSSKSKESMAEGVYSSLFPVLFINVAIALLLVVFSSQASAFLKFDQLFVRLLSILIVFESINTLLFVIIRSLNEIGKYFWFVTLKMALEIIFLVIMILFGYGLLGAIASLLIIRAAIFLALSVFIVQKVGFKFPDFSLFKKYASFGFPTMADGASYWLITSSDRYLIGFFLGIIFVGYYVPAYSIGYIISVFIFPISFVLSVVLPKLFDESNIEEVKNYLSHSLKYFLAVIIPATLGISILSKELLLVFSTKEIADNAYFVVPFVALSIAMYGITYFFGQVMALAKKTKVIASVWAAAAFLNLGLNIFLIPAMGILGAAITTFLAYFLSLALMRYLAFREFSFNIEWGFIFKVFAASAIMSAFILWFDFKGIAGLILSVILGIIVYLLLMALLGGFDRKEVNFLRKLIIQQKK